ncbi:hypothetical protein FGO68_gene13445 [Halteria grandinella]|uniref:Uncharacterized protein n=1 Tax=Halteria grandinella TaxID=5974 RepID=A0A8J8T0T5_HALGN|nr:hypothetical protein FGO68_gene13445 [Halteria grandinella]
MEKEDLRTLESAMYISDADFPVSTLQNRFKQSSTALLAITFILFFAYSGIKFWIHRKTGFGNDKAAMQELPEILPIFVRVVEYDLAPSLLVFFCIMGLGEFYVFAAIFGYFIICVGALLTISYKMNKPQMIKTFRIMLVAFTVCGFFNIFIDNMIFTDASPDRLLSFAYPGNQ